MCECRSHKGAVELRNADVPLSPCGTQGGGGRGEVPVANFFDSEPDRNFRVGVSGVAAIPPAVGGRHFIQSRNSPGGISCARFHLPCWLWRWRRSACRV